MAMLNTRNITEDTEFKTHSCCLNEEEVGQ